MRGRRAKALRHLAAEVFETMETTSPPGSQLVHKKTKVVKNHPLSLRGIYRRIKRDVG